MTDMDHAPAARPVPADAVRDGGHVSRHWGVPWLMFLAGGLAVAASRILSESRWWMVFAAVTVIALVIDLLRRRAVSRRTPTYE